MGRSFAFTLDLESDYASLVPEVRHRLLDQPERIRTVLRTLADKGVRGTAFVVGKLIESHPRIIDLFEEHAWEFELHSYSHDTAMPDSADEIERGIEVFSRRFGRKPMGYRAPQGRITREGIRRLVERGFSYDASVFPSYFPNPFRYLAMPREMHFWQVDADTRLLEIPFSSVSPLRLTLSASYMKLLGPWVYETSLRTFGFPKVICFDSHLHDFILDEDSYRELPPFWLFVYGQNKERGLALTLRLLDLLRREGYAFEYLSKIAAGALQPARATDEAELSAPVGHENLPHHSGLTKPETP